MKDLNDRDFNLEAVLGETFTVTQISTEKKAMAENQQPITYNLIPKAVLSLKCLQELPIIVVLMYQLYKQFVHQVRIQDALVSCMFKPITRRIQSIIMHVL